MLDSMTSKPMHPGMFARLDNAQWEFAETVRGVVGSTGIAEVLSRGWDNQDIAAWQMVEAVLWARSRGETWDAIGKVLHMSRQAVQQKFGAYTLGDVVAGYLRAGVDL